MDIFVRRGDSLWEYSRLFAVPLVLILDSNPAVTAVHLQVGQAIRIPGYVTENYTIKAGDTLWQLALRRGIHVEQIVLANRDLHPQALSVGQTIRIPVRVTWSIVQGQREYDYAAMMADIRQLQHVYPFLRSRSIGTTVMGKEIPEIRVGRGDIAVQFNGSFHANEWITTPIVMQFLNAYLMAVTNDSGIRGRRMLPLYARVLSAWVPMVNPDGVDLVLHGAPQQEPYRSNVLEINGGRTDFSGWKANIRGVDLNNQFPALWEREAARKPKHPSPRDYPGTAPLTEPEAIAMAQLTEASDFDRVLAFHTQGEVIYWGFLEREPPQSQRMAGEFARVSGYEAIRTVDSYAGYKDWFIYVWRRPGFTIELGHGTNPLPITQFGEIYERSLGIFLLALVL